MGGDEEPRMDAERSAILYETVMHCIVHDRFWIETQRLITGAMSARLTQQKETFQS